MSGPVALPSWSEVRTSASWKSILLGNGASIAISNSFSYDSLYAISDLNELKSVFESLHTTNFETVLNHLRTSELLCAHLGHAADDLKSLATALRGRLVGAIHQVHVAWEKTAAQRTVLSTELAKFRRVYSTNYDLILYWSTAASPFVNFFFNEGYEFDPLNAEPRDYQTPVYWLHGGLHLFRTDSGRARKRMARDGKNLITSFEEWARPPLYVAEGDHRAKSDAIASSDYLQHCYERLWRDSDPLVVLGHALGETDNHIAAALAQHPDRPIAYGVYPGSFNEVSLTIAKASAALTDCNVLFFDSTTHPITAPSMNSQGGQ